MLILAGVVISFTVGNQGIINKAQTAIDKYDKAAASEQMHMKVTEAKLKYYYEEQRGATLQELANYLEIDKDIEYVKLGKTVAAIDVTGYSSIIVKLKAYEYEFEIDGNMHVSLLGDSRYYTVVFNSNYATGTMEKQTFTYGVAQNLATNQFSKSNCTFLGWSTEQDAITPTYTNNQNVLDLADENNNEIILYAIWQSDEILTKIYDTVGQPYGEYGFTFENVSDVRFQATDWLNQFNYTKWIWISSYSGIHSMERNVNINFNTLVNKLGVTNFNGVSILITQGADSESGYYSTADSKITIKYTDNSTEEYTNPQSSRSAGRGQYTKDILFDDTKTVQTIEINLKGYDSDNGWASLAISEIKFF